MSLVGDEVEGMEGAWGTHRSLMVIKSIARVSW